MKKSSDKKGKIIAFLYLVGVIGMFLLVVLICLNRKEPKQKGNEETYQNITTLWTLDREGTQSVDVKKLGEYMDEESGALIIVDWLPTNISIKKHHGLCWIGLYALITGA